MKNRSVAVRQARLVLEDGSEYSGFSFGKPRSQAGEVVFTTAMTGYSQILTDPSTRGHILVFTYPLIGNCGVPVKPKTCEPFIDEYGLPLYLESPAVQVSGLVVLEACNEPSHYSSGATVPAWLEKNNIPGIYGIDTRSLTLRLRENGTMRGKILTEGSRDVTMDSGNSAYPAQDVSPEEIKTYLPSPALSREGEEAKGEKKPSLKIAVIDCGAKTAIFRSLLERQAEVIRLPWNHDLKNIEYDGLVLSTGPGDPKAYGKTIAAVRKVFDIGKPIFGIGLGCQIMALAAGGDTYKLPHSHRSLNQPCIETATERCYVTSQYHGYAVRGDSLPRIWESSFLNANDNTVEGIRSTQGPYQAVQFSPEGCPGPQDTEFLFDNFFEQVRKASHK